MMKFPLFLSVFSFAVAIFCATAAIAFSPGESSGPLHPSALKSVGAVQFDSTTVLERTSALLGPTGGALSDSPYGIASVWLSGSASLSNPTHMSMLNSDPFSNLSPGCEPEESPMTGVCFSFDDAGGASGRLRLNFSNSDQTSWVECVGPSPTWLDTVWFNLTVSWDFSHSGKPHVAAYIITRGGTWTPVSLGCSESPHFTTLSPNISDSRGFGINVGPPQGYGFYSQVYFDVGHTIVTSADTIRPDKLSRFVTNAGLPVDFGLSCSTPTGSRPTICFEGNASTFATNFGYGGAFALETGDSGKLTTSTYAPVGTLIHKPYLKWAIGSFAGGSTSASLSAYGNLITEGDLLMEVCGAADNSSTDSTGVMASPGFKPVFQVLNTNNAGATRIAAFYKFAAADESGSYSVSYGSGARDVGCTLLDYGGVAAIDANSVVSSDQDNSTGNTAVAPATTLHSPGEVLVYVAVVWGSNHPGGFQPPANFSQRFNTGWFFASSSACEIMLADAQMAAPGEVDATSMNWSGNNPAVAGQFGLRN